MCSRRWRTLKELITGWTPEWTGLCDPGGSRPGGGYALPRVGLAPMPATFAGTSPESRSPLRGGSPATSPVPSLHHSSPPPASGEQMCLIYSGCFPCWVPSASAPSVSPTPAQGLAWPLLRNADASRDDHPPGSQHRVSGALPVDPLLWKVPG